MFFSAPVGPAGDLLIPGVGSVQISGLNLSSSIISIKDGENKEFKTIIKFLGVGAIFPDNRQ